MLSAFNCDGLHDLILQETAKAEILDVEANILAKISKMRSKQTMK